MTAPAVPPRGLVCPTCGGAQLRVYKTRRPSNGLIVRSRRCPTCGHRVATEERVARALPPAPDSNTDSEPSTTDPPTAA